MRPRPLTRGLGGLLLALALVACSSADDDRSSAPASTTAPERALPTADLSEALTGGNGVFLGTATGAPEGFEESEHVAVGTATSYVGEIPGDGRAELEPGEEAAYRTRVVVRRPADFRGTAVVEWLNVSGGLDAAPDFGTLAPELARRGMAWVGVSAQRIGIEGGPVAVGAGSDLAGKGLKAIDPERYGSLSHPGDAFAYDIFTQVGRAVRELDGVERVLGIGESQSAFALTTYVNGVHPRAEAFDGYLLHSRGGAALPLGAPGEAVSIAAAIGGAPVRIRTDLDVPVFVLQTETDVTSILGSLAARQPDTDGIRLWELAGTAHADRSMLGPLADAVDCGVPINDGPQRFAARAALRHLDAWVRDGTPPPEAPLLEVEGTALVRDADGIARGGVRLPPVDVPVATLSGEPGPKGGVLCLLLGSTRPFTPEQLAARYASADEYLTMYEAAADASIEAGFALADDREELLAAADPTALR